MAEKHDIGLWGVQNFEKVFTKQKTMLIVRNILKQIHYLRNKLALTIIIII